MLHLFTFSRGLRIALTLILLSAAIMVQAEDESEAASPSALPVEQMLIAGPIPLVLPAFHEADQAGVKLKDLLDSSPITLGDGWPCDGCEFRTSGGKMASWKSAKGTLAWKKPDSGSALAYAVFVIRSDRWQKASLEIRGGHPVLAALNGATLALQDGKSEEDQPALKTGEMTLPRGTHLIVLRTVSDPEVDAPWEFSVAVAPTEEHDPSTLELLTGSERFVDIQTILNAPRISGASVSPDGKLVAIRLSEYRDGNNRETWLEIRATDSGDRIRMWRGDGNPGQIQWLPDGHLISWTTRQDDASTIHVLDLDSGEAFLALADVTDLGSWRWAPDGKSIFYEIKRESDPDDRKVKRVAHPADRQPWWRGRSHLMQAFVPGDLNRRLTAGPLSPGGWEISEDGRKLLFFLGEPDITNRPFSTTELWMMDLETLETEMILDDTWISGATFSGDGKTLCLRGSPSAFDGLGRDLPDGVQANDYGGQLYLYDLESREPTPITRDFRPDVGWFAWSRADGMIYTRTTDTQYNRVYRYDVKKDHWEMLDTGMDVASGLVLPRKGSTAVAWGSSVSTPNRVFTLDLKKKQARLLLDPGATAYEDIKFGKVEDYDAAMPNGEILDGFVYYPPDFDPSRTYPVIVYYYGGTSPITRDFGGRYPKNIWAGQGYIVYVPNPSGATGYGQEYAARHVNDWGELTGTEVIEGTRSFLADHPFADADRVGCIGASYGGFLTQYLITHTDIFAAAVSHAGISSISSYWGEGMWGYGYGARALANAYPWQNREIYVERSPLFHADKVTTPLLLLHGDSDINVPVGESDQMFTALKILGKDVEYVQIQGQDHHILDHEQRMVWNDTILSYFAKYLKLQPEWWEAMYPEPKDYR